MGFVAYKICTLMCVTEHSGQFTGKTVILQRCESFLIPQSLVHYMRIWENLNLKSDQGTKDTGPPLPMPML